MSVPLKNYLHLIVGPMYSGKSEMLIDKYNKYLRYDSNFGTKAIVLSPSLNTRDEDVKSRTGTALEAIKLDNIEDVWKDITPEIEYVFIDEYFMFGGDMTNTVKEMLEKGLTVYISGLDLDFRGIPMKHYPALKEIATYKTRTTAICVECKGVGLYTRKDLTTGNADQTIEVEVGNVKYDVTCTKCHNIIGKNQ